MRTLNILTKLSLINIKLQLVKSEIISNKKSDYYTKDNKRFNKILSDKYTKMDPVKNKKFLKCPHKHHLRWVRTFHEIFQQA